MTDNLPTLAAPDFKADLNRTLSPAEAAELRQHAMAYAPSPLNPDGTPRFVRPVPNLLLGLPWIGSNEEITDAIAAQILTSPNPDRMPDDDGTISFQKLAGHTVEVHRLAVAAGDRDGGWAGYLLLEVSVDGSPERVMANTGAKEAVTRLALAWYRNELPLKGRVAEKPLKNHSGNLPLMFLAETDF